jgi:hypothetical protein
MNNPTTKLRVMVSLATLLCVSSSMADVVHRQFGEHNRMVRVSNDDWQPPGFDTGREIPAVYAADADIAIDGLDTEPEWAAAPDVTVSLAFGNVHEASVKALYTDDDVYIRVRWADSTMDREHRPWVWDTRSNHYAPGQQIEDSLLLSFEAGCEWSPSLLAGYGFDFDGWHWLAARSDPLGQAWDVIGNMSRPNPDGLDKHEYDSRGNEDLWILKFNATEPVDSMDFAPWNELDRSYLNWRMMPRVTVNHHLDRLDSETSVMPVPPPEGPPGDTAAVFPSFQPVQLEGAAGEVAAKGHWEDGYWTVEFRRIRITPDTSINDTLFNRLTQFALYIFDRTERFDEASESERLYLRFIEPETRLVRN